MPMSGSKQSENSLEELSKKLDEVLNRLSLLEDLITERPELEGLTAALRLTRVGVGMYGEPLRIAARLKDAQTFLQQKTVAQDEISRCVIQALAVKGPLNISAITRQVSAMRGKASRRIVRQRVQSLLQKGILVKTDGKTPTYNLASKNAQ
jgi:hypothetical protein